MNTTTDNRIDEVSVAYKPANTCDSVNGWLYYVLVAISLAALFSDSIKSANWKGQGELTIVFLKVSFLVLTLAMFSLFLVSKFLLIPSAERVRRKQLLADALGATITPEITVRYYNNGFPASIQRLAANVMENSLFVSVQRPDRFFRAVGLQIGLRRVTRYGRPGHLIPKGSRQLAGGKRSATTAEVHGPAGLNVGIKR
jgi:hypothetical protein